MAHFAPYLVGTAIISKPITAITQNILLLIDCYLSENCSCTGKTSALCLVHI